MVEVAEMPALSAVLVLLTASPILMFAAHAVAHRVMDRTGGRTTYHAPAFVSLIAASGSRTAGVTSRTARRSTWLPRSTRGASCWTCRPRRRMRRYVDHNRRASPHGDPRRLALHREPGYVKWSRASDDPDDRD